MKPSPLAIGAVAIALGATAVALLSRSSTPASKKTAASPPAPPAPPASWRDRFVTAAQGYIGALYQWGGGRAPGFWGVDCSGLVYASLKDADLPIPPGTVKSTAWWASLPHVDVPQKGDLAFYGANDTATHVVVVDGYDPSTGLASVISANGGHLDTTPEYAEAHGDHVKAYDSHLYRQDFLGFASLEETMSGVHRQKRVNVDLPLACAIAYSTTGTVNEETCGC